MRNRKIVTLLLIVLILSVLLIGCTKANEYAPKDT